MTDSETDRKCFFCHTPITACMGSVLAGDLLAFLEGKRQEIPRELCALCLEKLNVLLRSREAQLIAEIELLDALYRAAAKARTFWQEEVVRLDRRTADLGNALANLTDAFLDRHGCFPLDQRTPQERRWVEAMKEAYRLIGQPNTEARRSALARIDRNGGGNDN